MIPILVSGGSYAWTTLIESWPPFLVPACFLFSVLLCRALTFVRGFKLLCRFWNPLGNFITFEDIPGPLDTANRNVGFRLQILTHLAAFATLFWVGNLTFAAVEGHPRQVIACILYSLAWAYIALRGIVRRLTTPPYLAILFATTELTLSVADLLDRKSVV